MDSVSRQLKSSACWRRLSAPLPTGWTMRKLRWFMVIVGVMTVCGGCVTKPTKARQETKLSSAEQERQVGAWQAKKIEQQMSVLHDEGLTAYLNAVGQRLAQQSSRQDITYTFRILDVPEPNAFAFPGGYIYITRGLLALLNSEDELAGVIGHEIGHVVARHRVQQIAREGRGSNITNLVSGVTGPVGPVVARIVGDAGELVTGYMFASYSREQEREADQAGQELAARAGWEPAGLSKVLSTLERGDSLRQSVPRWTTFLDSHPAFPERVVRSAESAKGLQRAAPDPLSASPGVFLTRLDGVVVGSRAASGVIDGRNFRHPDLNYSVQFPEKWNLANSPLQATALAPDGDALMVLKIVAEGGDPMDGARALEKASGSPILRNTKRFTIGNSQAALAQVYADTKQGKLWLGLAWIAHGGHIYQLAGIGPMNRHDALHSLFDTMIHSFRPLSQSERANLREKRIRLTKAQADETLDALVTRTKSSWSSETAAVANGLVAEDPLQEGQIVKVAIAELYASKIPQHENTPQL
jgi:predicted Zn-dependent protease